VGILGTPNYLGANYLGLFREKVPNSFFNWGPKVTEELAFSNQEGGEKKVIPDYFL